MLSWSDLYVVLRACYQTFSKKRYNKNVGLVQKKLSKDKNVRTYKKTF